MMRPTIVFGPGSHWIYGFGTALGNHTACLVNGARGICNSIYVDNLAHAVRLALIAPKVDGEAFLVGDAETVTWRDLYTPIADALGFDIDLVPSVDPPEARPGIRQLYVEPMRSSELGKAVLTRVPPGAKSLLRGAVRSLLRRRAKAIGPASAAATPSGGLVERPIAPVVSPEMVALQSCRWKLPHEKAARLLGYSPPVSFAEGCRRSVEWFKVHEQEMRRSA
jgi:nucleoside-diphosphate-sugar epimerase